MTNEVRELLKYIDKLYTENELLKLEVREWKRCYEALHEMHSCYAKKHVALSARDGTLGS